MLGKLVFYLSAFTSAMVGLVLVFRGYAVPGVMMVGFGYVLFNVVIDQEERT
jgi:hypothetical protein